MEKETKWLMVHAIEAVRSGSHALEYDNGDLEGLRAFLRKAFPDDNGGIVGSFRYYFGVGNGWACDNESYTELPSILLSEIQPDEPEFVNDRLHLVEITEIQRTLKLLEAQILACDRSEKAVKLLITEAQCSIGSSLDRLLSRLAKPNTITITTTYPVEVVLNGNRLYVRE